MDEFQKQLIETTVEKTAGAAYEDLAKPTMNALGTVASLPIRSIRVLCRKWEKWIVSGEENLKKTDELIQKKLEMIPDNLISEPEPYIAIPTLQQLTYCIDNKFLREMYANLLVQSIKKDSKENAHPAFVEIIKQLTPFEARFLFESDMSNIYVPLIDVDETERIEESDSFSRHNLVRNVCIPLFNCDIDKVPLCIENLERLKIIEILDSCALGEDAEYEKIESLDFIQDLIKVQKAKNTTIVYCRKVYTFTTFGKLFMKTCVQEE
ncbi:MAG: DUF4393 domain-containing protein [Treponema sp.]|nr:DUF4393 domain-containing protein [Treponema sp.]